MFYDMCGIDDNHHKTSRTRDLCAIKPLEDGTAFEVVDSKTIWHPIWNAQVNNPINAQFLASVVERVSENEKV
jgi:hypothetical protein